MTHMTRLITLFRYVTMFCGTDNIPRNIPPYLDLNNVVFSLEMVFLNECCRTHVLDIPQCIFNA